MSVPCVIGRPLEVAERLLCQAGVEVAALARTQPPRGGPAGPARVVRQRATEKGVELVVAASAPLPDGETCHD